MNLFDVVLPHPHLQSLYPEGINGDILIGRVEFSSSGHIFLTLHTKERPSKEIAKWGSYGRDFNTVSITLSVCNAESVYISGWYMTGFVPIDIEQQKDIFVIRQCNGNCKIEIKAEFLVFQSCSVYLS